MSELLRVKTPLTDEDVERLKTGTRVFISGVIYTARDAAHRRMVALLDSGQELPFDIRGQVIYYAGPAPAKPGAVIGPCGPTTSYRMDPYAPRLIELGLKGMIGKGKRSPQVKQAMMDHKSVYLAAIGGLGALLARTIKEAEIIAYEDLGTEAIRRMVVEDLPAIVAFDIRGKDIYSR